jgi:predicted DNA-binding protein YlxM (UPF0122 family)
MNTKRNQDIIEKYKNGKSAIELAKEYKLSRQSIHGIIRHQNKVKITPLKKEYYKFEVRQGKKYAKGYVVEGKVLFDEKHGFNERVKNRVLAALDR